MTVDEGVGLTRLALSDAEFDELGAGLGGASALATLQAGQVSRRSAILLASAQQGTEARSALDVLARAQCASADAAVPALRHPFLGVWAYSKRRGRTDDASYLTGLAVAAALRAGVDADLELRARAGGVTLPGMGSLRLSGAAGAAAGIRCADGRLSVRLGSRRVTLEPLADDHPELWWPVRRVAAAGTALWIDDLDEHRDCFGIPPADRLGSAQFRSVREVTCSALELLHRRFPGEARGLDSLVMTLVPLRARHGPHASASSRRASGSVGLLFPMDPQVTALLLLHEFQHVKLSALLDLLDLVRPWGGARHRVGWRPDARPTVAVLHGAYAHLAVARFWLNQRGDDAADRFVRTAQLVRAAIDVLIGSGELTPLGERFVALMSDSLRITTGF